MRIALVGTELAAVDTAIGALEKLCVGWSAGLANHGAKVFLFSHGLPTHSPPEGVDVVLFDQPEELSGLAGKTEIDVVITNNRPMWDIQAKLARINVFHNYPDAWAIPKGTNDTKVTKVLKACTNLAVSRSLAAEINARFPAADARVLPPFIDESFLGGPPPMKEPTRNSNRIRVLFPNRTLEKKGLRWLIRSVSEYMTDQIELTVVRNISPWNHETAEQAALLALTRSCPYAKIVEKKVDVGSLKSLYLDHDVIVTPSTRDEGLGLIPLEAQALGLPVVASNAGGLSESVYPPNKTVPIGSVPLLADAIFKAPETSYIRRCEIADSIAQTFSLEASLAHLMREVDALLNRNGLS